MLLQHALLDLSCFTRCWEILTESPGDLALEGLTRTSGQSSHDRLHLSLSDCM